MCILPDVFPVNGSNRVSVVKPKAGELHGNPIVCLCCQLFYECLNPGLDLSLALGTVIAVYVKQGDALPLKLFLD